MTDKNTEKKTTSLTISMLVYNDEKWLSEAIESILNQTYVDFKIILSDDCSTDRSSEICREYAKKDKRVTYVRQPKNLGSYLHAKLLFESIDTVFFLTCSGHDMYHPQFIEKLLPILLNNRDIIVVYSRSQTIKFNGEYGDVLQDDYSTDKINNPMSRYAYVFKNLRAASIFQGIWRSEVIKEIYLKPVIANDTLMLIQASIRGKFKQYPEILFFMRQNRSPANNAKEEGVNNMFRRQIKMITGSYPKFSKPLFLLKNQFIYENIKMILKENLGWLPKLQLIIYSIYRGIYRLYIVPSLYPLYKKLKPSLNR